MLKRLSKIRPVYLIMSLVTASFVKKLVHGAVKC